MPFKSKAIAISVAALLVAGGGAYAFLSDDNANKPVDNEAAATVQTSAKPEANNAQSTSSGASSEQTDAPKTDAPTAQQPPAQGQMASQAPKKLTRQQLTPPPATEDEKLQKAAEQESNF
jgi:hypothetical protein